MAERYFSYEPGWSPEQIAKQMQAIPGVRTCTVPGGEWHTTSLDGHYRASNGESGHIYPMSVPVGNHLGNISIRQTLHALIVTPDGEPRTLIEVNTWSEQDAKRGAPVKRWALLGELCSMGRPEVVDVLVPSQATQMTGPQIPSWRAGIAQAPDMHHILLMHHGGSATEVAHNMSPALAWDHTIPLEVWAPPSRQCYDRIHSIAR